MEGCTLDGIFIVLEQEMQEFGRLSMLSDYFSWSGHAQKRLCGSPDPVHLVFGAIWWKLLNIVYPAISSCHYRKISEDVTSVHMDNFLFSLNTVLTMSGAITMINCTITSPVFHFIQKRGPFKPSLHEKSVKMYQSQLEQHNWKVTGSTFKQTKVYGMCNILLLGICCHSPNFSINLFNNA